MTRNKKAKQAARQLRERTGVPYTAARRHDHADIPDDEPERFPDDGLWRFVDIDREPMSDQERAALPGPVRVLLEDAERVATTDVADTEAVLLAAWNGFATAEMVGHWLGRRDPNDAVLAANAARRVFAPVASVLRAAPSLPYTDTLIIDLGRRRRADHDIPAQTRQNLLLLSLALNAMLPRAAPLAAHPADRHACQRATELACELGHCWQGRLSTYL